MSQRQLHRIANRVLDECESTNLLARELGMAGYASGTWVSSEIQTLGRGRRGRVWVSDQGNLYLSLVIRDVPMQRWTWVPLRTGVLIADALSKLYPGVSVQLKWPNDLIADHRKLGGILCEGVSEGGRSFLVVGFGINVTNAPDLAGGDLPAVSLSELLGMSISPNDIRNDIRESVSRGLSSGWDDEFVNATAMRFLEKSVFSPGENIRWSENEGAETREGRFLGLGRHGELKVATDSGEEALLSADLQLGIRPLLSPSARR